MINTGSLHRNPAERRGSNCAPRVELARRVSTSAVSIMTRSLLILTLVTMQLFAGSTASVYLCVSHDGSYCCIDTGPASCTCCQEAEEDSSAHEVCCAAHADENHHLKPCEDSSEHSVPRADGQPVVSDPCGCTHIPVRLSSHQAVSVGRSSVPGDLERVIPATVWLCFSRIAPEPLCRAIRHRSEPPPLDPALIVISTTVIRC